MWYEGTDVAELAELLRYESEPVIVGEAFLVQEDMEHMHGWILDPNWYKTEILSWGSGAVSSKTTRHQCLTPPVDWVPEEVPVPDPEPEVPVEGEPEPEVPPAEDPAPETPSEGDTDEHTS